jgi:hypothetical protein
MRTRRDRSKEMARADLHNPKSYTRYALLRVAKEMRICDIVANHTMLQRHFIGDKVETGKNGNIQS